MVATSTRPRTAARLKAKADQAAGTEAKRASRTAEQRIADLEAQIEHVKRRAAAKKVKKDPALRYVSGALRSVDKALASSNDQPVREALNEARAGLAAILALSGALVPTGHGNVRPPAAGPEIDEAALLSYIQAHGGSRSEEIAAGLGTDTAGIRGALVALREEGQVAIEGKARATRYSVIKPKLSLVQL